MADIVVNFKEQSQQLIKSLKEQRDLLNQTAQAQENVGKESDKTTRKEETNSKKQIKSLDSVEKKTSGLGKAFTRLGGFIAGAFAVDRLAAFGREAIRLAGQMEGVERAFQKLNDPALLGNLREATRGTISDLELMQSAVRANNFQIPLEKLATFFEFATNRAAETGESVDYLVNSIVDGIGRKSTLVLDNLGISASELQEEVRLVGDFGEAAGNIIERQMQEAGDVIETTAQRTARLNAQLQNQQAQIGKQLTPAWNTFLDVVGKTFFTINETLDAGRLLSYGEALDRNQKIAENVARTFENIANSVESTTETLEEQDIRWEEWALQMNSSIDEAKDQLQEYKDNFGSLTIEEADRVGGVLIPALEEKIAAYERVINLIDSERAALDSKSDSEKGSIQINEELNKELAEQAERYEEIKTEIDELLDSIVTADDDAKISLDDLIDIDEDIENSEFVEGFDEATKKMRDAGFDNMGDYFKFLRDQQDEVNEYILNAGIDLANQLLDRQIQLSREETQAKIDAADEDRQQALESLRIQQQQELSQENLTIQQKLQIDRRYNAQRKTIEQDYDEEVKKIQREQAEREKSLAIFRAIINTAVAVAEALPNVALSIAAGIAGAAQIALISSEPLPQFHEGTEYLQRGRNKPGRDTIPLWADEGEAIIKSRENKRMPGLAKAWNDGKVKEFINDRFVVPELQKAVREMEYEKQKGFARNIADSLVLNSNNRDVVKALSKNARIARRGNELLEDLNKNRRHFKFFK